MREIQEAITEKVTDEEILYLNLNEMTLEIGSKLDAAHPAWEPRDHSQNNWCSEIHHPCLKNLVHCRVDWEQRQPIDTEGMWRVQEGKRIEWEVTKWLGDIGFEITESQRRFTTDDVPEYADLKISGRIDGIIPLNKKLPAPFAHLKGIKTEIKTVNPNYWSSVKTIEAIKRHPKFWINKIPSQLNTYLALSNDPGGLLIIVTFGKRPRILPMLFDQDLWDHDQARVRKVNAHVDAGTYPEPIPFDATICGMCDFNHICTPIQTTKMSQVDPMDIFKLEMYLEEKENAERFKVLHAELIGDKKKPGKYRGMDAIIEDIEITTSIQMRKKYEVPKEEKEKYYVGDNEVIITKISRMGK